MREAVKGIAALAFVVGAWLAMIALAGFATHLTAAVFMAGWNWL